MKILLMIRDIFYKAHPHLIEEMRTLGDVRVLFTDRGIDKQRLHKEVADIDIIVVAVVKVDREVIDAAPNLKYIIKYGAGYDNIDVNYAKKKGIPVTNAPGQNAESVADHAFGLMLAAARNIPQKNQELKSGEWALSVGSEIYQKRLGIVGFGSIGKAIARRAFGFQMDTVAFGHYKDYETAKKYNVKFVEEHELFATSDYIMLSTSLNEKNRELVNKETLSLMKPTTYLINIARGGLVNEEDLINALKNNRIQGAGLDVFASEPTQSELLTLSDVIVTPHVAGSTYEAIKRIGDVTISNIKRFQQQQPLMFLVNET